MKKYIWICLLGSFSGFSQYFQQHIQCTMTIDMDVKNYQYTGKQKLVYHNKSNDTLKKLYFHLYPNAFQPNSEMDYHCQMIKDPDPRMMIQKESGLSSNGQSKISKLHKSEQGFIKIHQLKQASQLLNYEIEDTVLEVPLSEPVLPNQKTTIEMDFTGQVPNQIRRSGRNNKEGVALSMTQWYPKIAVYDKEGWHTNPYIGREFYGEWGDYDVTIAIDQSYILGGTGYLENAQEIGYGYAEQAIPKPVNGKLRWHFKAPNVHDFSWVADPDFIHQQKQLTNGPLLHLLYKKNLNDEQKLSWQKLLSVMDDYFAFYQTKIGKYPYQQYSVLQGGDGGMEYGMCTLVTGQRTEKSLFSVVAHELAHSWFQFLLATNEGKYAWMDEGFTTYITAMLEQELLNKQNAYESIYAGYRELVSYKIEEPLGTHADAFQYNYGYGISSYNKGALFLKQLEYIIGKEQVIKTLQYYFNHYKFTHPDAVDFVNCAQKVSGIHLGWFLNFWTQTTGVIDYAVAKENDFSIQIKRIGTIPMPLEILVTYQDGTSEMFYAPLSLMRGKKAINATILKDQTWNNPTYTFKTVKKISSIVLDPQKLLADVDMKNQVFSQQ